MSDATPRFGLPFILPGQAQKEVWHNEALVAIDSALHPAVETGPLAAPPAEPVAGQCWIVAAGATGAWNGADGRLALWTEGGWRFVAPQPGMAAWDKAAGFWRHWTGSAWSNGAIPASGLVIGGQQVVRNRQPAILTPSEGTVIDAEARAAIGAIIATLMSHGLTD